MDMSIDDIKNEIAELENKYKPNIPEHIKAKIDHLKWCLEEKLQKDKNEFYAKLDENKRKNEENKKTNKPKRYK